MQREDSSNYSANCWEKKISSFSWNIWFFLKKNLYSLNFLWGGKFSFHLAFSLPEKIPGVEGWKDKAWEGISVLIPFKSNYFPEMEVWDRKEKFVLSLDFWAVAAGEGKICPVLRSLSSSCWPVCVGMCLITCGWNCKASSAGKGDELFLVMCTPGWNSRMTGCFQKKKNPVVLSLSSIQMLSPSCDFSENFHREMRFPAQSSCWLRGGQVLTWDVKGSEKQIWA